MPAFEHFFFVLGIAAAIPQGCGLHVRLESRGRKNEGPARRVRWDWRVNKIVRQSQLEPELSNASLVEFLIDILLWRFR